MAGSRIQVLPRTTFNYFSVQGGQSSPLVILTKNLDVSPYREAVLLVRVHTYTISQPDAKITVAATPTAQTTEDPTALFVLDSAGISKVDITNALAATALLTLPIPSPFGAMLGVGVQGIQDSVAGSLSATISIDLSVKV